MASCIYERDGKWWHPDECWLDEFGPFDSEKEAEQSLADFIFYLENGLPPYSAQMAHGV